MVRALDNQDLQQAGIEGVVINTFHLLQEPGIEKLKDLGGIGNLMNWQRLTASDSGGFQMLTYLHKQGVTDAVTDQGVRFTLSTPQGKQFIDLTPERSIQIQFAIGSDIKVCLDDYSPPEADEVMAMRTVKRTIEWAKRCKEEFEKQLEQKKTTDHLPLTNDKNTRTQEHKNIKTLKQKNTQQFNKLTIYPPKFQAISPETLAGEPSNFSQVSTLDSQLSFRPRLIAVVQGDRHWKIREHCAKELVKIGFDGYGLGGWLHPAGKLDTEIIQAQAEWTPDDSLRFALGVGYPRDIVILTRMGYHLFDCVLPTRDARHGRLYILSKAPEDIDWDQESEPKYLYINQGKYALQTQPLDSQCLCHTCQYYSRAYLHHLFRIQDPLGWRLASIHNLTTYTRVITFLRKTIEPSK